MEQLFVGVGQVSLFMRQSRSLKDKRSVVKSIIQKLRNEGFSVTECAHSEETKRASLGFTFAGSSHDFVKTKMDETARIFIGDFEILRNQHDIFDYGGEEFEMFKWEEDTV